MFESSALIDMKKEYDSYFIKNLIWKSFPNKNGEDFNTAVGVYSINEYDESINRIVLRSKDKPIDSELLKWESNEITESFLDSKRYVLGVRINSSKRVSGTGKRIGTTDNDEITKRFIELSKLNGFSVNDAGVLRTGCLMFYGKQGRGFHSYADIIADINVSDITLFKKAFLEGIGKSRGYGLGMVKLQKVTE